MSNYKVKIASWYFGAVALQSLLLYALFLSSEPMAILAFIPLAIVVAVTRYRLEIVPKLNTAYEANFQEAIFGTKAYFVGGIFWGGLYFIANILESLGEWPPTISGDAKYALLMLSWAYMLVVLPTLMLFGFITGFAIGKRVDRMRKAFA